MLTHTYTFVTCAHPPDRVTADKLCGAHTPTFVQWCQVCGAVRVGEYVDAVPGEVRDGRIKWVGDRDEPELRQIAGDRLRV